MYRYSIVPQPDQFQQHLAKLFIRSAAKELKLTWEPLVYWFTPDPLGTIIRDQNVRGFTNGYFVWFLLGLEVPELRIVARHEVQHCRDLRADSKEYQFYDDTQKQLLELRAESFEHARMNAEETVLVTIGEKTMSHWETLGRATRAALAKGFGRHNEAAFSHQICIELDAIDPGWRSRTSAEVPCDLQAEYERLQDPFLENWEKAIIQRRIKGIR